MADLVQTHANTIPTLARGFLECRKYISPVEVTKFLDEHLRARIGTRLIAEQHIALHMSSQAQSCEEPENYIGVINTTLRPADIVISCGSFVAEICELKYGVRPSLIVNGDQDATFAYVPVHLEYIITELLKNAFRATVETKAEKEAIEVTIAVAPEAENGVTIRIRDRGGGISPAHLPNIWSYSFTTFTDDDEHDALDTILTPGGSTLAGLGYGLPLGRAYAEYFGGSILVQSIWGWGTDVYLNLKGIGKL